MRIKIISLDYLVKKEPHIRVFGMTDSGQRALVHIHQVFPYFYIKYKGTQQDVKDYCRLLQESINLALGLSFGNRYPIEIVKDIIPVRGLPFYGFHSKYECFLKIYINNPSLQTRLVGLLEGGAILEPFKVYDAHVPYLLQFLIDYNLYGMDYIELDHVRFRQPYRTKTIHLNGYLTEQDCALYPSKEPRTTFCDLELDAWSQDIANRRKLTERPLEHSIDPNVSKQTQKEPLVWSMAAIWQDENKRRLKMGLDPIEPTAKLSQVGRETPQVWPNKDELEEKLIDNIPYLNHSGTPFIPPEIEHLLTAFQAIGYLHASPFQNQDNDSVQSQYSELEPDQEQLDELSQQARSMINQQLALDLGSQLSQLEEPVDEFEEFDWDQDMLDAVDGLPQFDGTTDLTPRKRKREDPELDRSKKNKSDLPDANLQNLRDKKTVEKRVIQKTAEKSVKKKVRHPIHDFLSDMEKWRRQKPVLDSEPPVIRNPSGSFCQDLLESIQGGWSPEHHRTVSDSAFFVDPPRPFTPSNGTFGLVNPPTTKQLMDSLKDYGLLFCEYKKPFFSNPKDIPDKPFHYGGTTFKFTKPELKKFQPRESDDSPFKEHLYLAQQTAQSKTWELHCPITFTQAEQWIESSQKHNHVFQHTQRGFQFDGQTPSQDSVEDDYLLMLSMEVHCKTRDDLSPDPEHDPILGIFYCLSHNSQLYKCNGMQDGYLVGCVLVRDQLDSKRSGIQGYPVQLVDSEQELIEAFCQMTRGWDPEFLVGYEIHKQSWGYLIERAQHLSMNCQSLLSRIMNDQPTERKDEYGAKKQSGLSCTGRIFLNVWRQMTVQLTLASYSIESCVYQVLHKRIAKMHFKTLTQWYQESMLMRWRTLKYYLERVQYPIMLLDKTELMHQTTEFAKVFGIDFYSVLTRGSQFKVESVLSRLARPENYIMFSPKRKDVAEMRALECIPLNTEPLTELYVDPVLLLDFQSLYPSVMVAYNYCFSTILGTVGDLHNRKLGCLDDFELDIDPDILRNHVNISPNGTVFVNSKIRQGALGRMLTEILETRFMVKNSMKMYKRNQRLMRILDAKQLALKLLANVTYGYTSASFSGRMPCSAIADAIVQSGRTILEQSISYVQSQGFPVAYCDTDSMFVKTPGLSKKQAFETARQLVDGITRRYPQPVVLKLEKVYLPCVLLAKKRYVGMMLESPDSTPVFDAKGIETVRRDGCPIVSKTMEKALKILFRNKDLSLVKEYLIQIWTRILKGDVSPIDFIIAREVRMGSYSEKGVLPPGAHLSAKLIEYDKRAAPEYKERVPFVVVHRGLKHRLVDACVSPYEYLQDRELYLHGTYYIEKQIIPALNRVFKLVGVDLVQWYNDMPKIKRAMTILDDQKRGKTIDSFYRAMHCIICHKPTEQALCKSCLEQPNVSLQHLGAKVRKAEQEFVELQERCRRCTGHETLLDLESQCISLDCNIYFRRNQALEMARQSQKWFTELESLDREERDKIQWL
ncbi:hypothetical protein EDD86DRAFT_190413 [Gorgonomyces haynaldii]|nr:hypothetical protein EDD86DRAFT_190413 [Gorgonomyces haynaldii]